MSRTFPLFLGVAMMLAGGVAHADLPGGFTVKFDRLQIHEDGGPLKEPSVDEKRWQYFNYAHCKCAIPNVAADPAYNQKTFSWDVIPDNLGTTTTGSAEVWTGAGCDGDTTVRNMNCARLDYLAIDLAGVQRDMKSTIEINLFDLMNPEPYEGAPTCAMRALVATTWVIADGDMDGQPEYFVPQTVETDSLAPPIPTDFRATGAENAIDISWTPSADTADIYAYQALCAKADGTPADVTERPAPRYVTASDLCGTTSDIKMTAVDVDTGDLGDAGASGGLADGLAALDSAFLCGESMASTANGLRITGLVNNVGYQVVILAIDKFGNAQGASFASLLTPTPATDFWEDIQQQGSEVEGGFCLIAETYGDDNPLTRSLRAFRDNTLADSAFGRWVTRVYYATLGTLGGTVQGSLPLRIISGVLLAPLVIVALAWHYLTLPGLLALIALVVIARRRRRVLGTRFVHATATIALLVVVAPRAASADDSGGFDPYWNDPGAGSTQFAEEESFVKWHVGVRVGPYTPQIDAGLGLATNPYKQMFGGYSVVPMLDVDRILWRGFGQLGIGGNIGFMSKKDRAWIDMSDPTSPTRPRSPGDNNTFRLLPIAISAVYRFSYLDDEYGIPLVPYAKAGLGYYIWWINAPNGDLAFTCETGDGCMKNKAAGASLGFTGAIGLSIRAERIDAGAATSMRESGIEHAGFYGELSLAKVDGFGDSTKLSVGDVTWFAGVDFEF